MNKLKIFTEIWIYLQKIPLVHSIQEFQKHEMKKTLSGACTLSQILELPPKDLDEWAISFLSLGEHVDKLTAIKLIAYLPVIVSKELSQFNKYGFYLKDFYEFLTIRLLSWELNIPLNLKSHWYPYEGFAILSKARYKMIFALWERGKIDENIYGTPSFTWLLAEIAVYTRIINNQETREVSYRNGTEHIRYLNNFFEEQNLCSIKDIESFLKNTDLIFEEIARNIAIEDVNFDENYYQPYIKALHNWFKKCRNDENLTYYILKPREHPKRRGRTLGVKNKR